MFQFRRFPSYTYLIQYRIPCGGFPHSEISGSMLICSSPKLIAAYHVLHRLLMPRHSPCALFSLTSSKSASALFRFRHQLTLPSKTSFRSAVSPLKFKPACAGLWICKRCGAGSSLFLTQSTILEKSIYWFSIIVELCRLIFGFLSFSKNCIFTLADDFNVHLQNIFLTVAFS